MCSKLTCLIVSIVVGVVAIILGAILGFKVLPDFIDSVIANNVQLQWSNQYSRFQKLPFPLRFKIYVFNVTNAADVMKGKPPVLKEIGPYVYRQYNKKINVTYNETEEMFTYEQIQSFEFDEELSKPLKEDDLIMVLNVPKLGILENIESRGIGAGFSDDTEGTLFHNISMKEYLFQGYIFCQKGKKEVRGSKRISRKVKEMAELMNPMVVIKDNNISFSFFGHKNNTPNGVYKIFSGISDPRKTGQIVTIDGLKHTKFKNKGNSRCNKVRGTDSSIYSPYNHKDTVNEVFISDICRTVSLDYLEDVKYMGIPGHRHVMRKNTLDSPSKNKENECFCIKNTSTVDNKRECHPDGFLDMGYCINFPLLVSFPHFLWADPKYLKKVTGLSPDEEKHRTFVDLEPNTGSPMRGAKRLQFNMVLRRLDKFSEFTKKVPKVVFPILWVEEGLEIPQDLVDMLKEKVLSKLPIVDGVKWGLIVAGIVAILIGVILYLFCSKKIMKRLGKVTRRNTRQTTDDGRYPTVDRRHTKDDIRRTTDDTRHTTDDRGQTTNTRQAHVPETKITSRILSQLKLDKSRRKLP